MPQSVRCKEYSTLCSPNQCSIQATKTNFILACYKIIQPNPNSELIQPNQGALFQYQLCFDCVQTLHCRGPTMMTVEPVVSNHHICLFWSSTFYHQKTKEEHRQTFARQHCRLSTFTFLLILRRGPCLTFAISSGEGAHQVPHLLLVKRSAQNVDLKQKL